MDDVKSFNANQKLVFLEKLQKSNALTPERAQLLGKTYGLLDTKNAELKTAYYLIALKAKDPTCVYGTSELLGQVGRMKYVRPLFRALNKDYRELALETFAKHQDFYHPICKAMIQKDLGL